MESLIVAADVVVLARYSQALIDVFSACAEKKSNTVQIFEG